jgi:hypothetical protein
MRNAAILALFIALSAPTVGLGSPVSVNCGVGYNKSVNEGAPDGAVGIHGSLLVKAQRNLSAGLEVGYLDLGTYYTVLFGSQADAIGSADVTQIPITAGFEYNLSPEGTMHPLLVGGVGLYVSKIDAEVTVLGQQGSLTLSDSSTETDLGFNLGSGIKFGRESQTVRFGADARFHVVLTEEESTRMVNVMGRLYFN